VNGSGYPLCHQPLHFLLELACFLLLFLLGICLAFCTARYPGEPSNLLVFSEEELELEGLFTLLTWTSALCAYDTPCVDSGDELISLILGNGTERVEQ
jgi:hypothetical protein